MKKEVKKAKVGFTPSGDRLLVQPDSAEDEKTASGFIIPDSARKEKPERGTVIAVGEGKRTDKGDVLPMQYSIGEEVVFSKYGYQEVMIDDVEYYIIDAKDILGTF